MKDEIIIITGPAGVGKSTTSNYLVKNLKKSAYVEGDTISHMSIVGREKPWESESAHNLVWKNMKDLTKNFLEDGCQVVIDWIIFIEDVKSQLSDFLEQGVTIRYVILWAEEDVHLERDKNRPEAIQMGERVIILRNQFMNSGADSRFYIDNTSLGVEEVIEIVLNSDRFIINK